MKKLINASNEPHIYYLTMKHPIQARKELLFLSADLSYLTYAYDSYLTWFDIQIVWNERWVMFGTAERAQVYLNRTESGGYHVYFIREAPGKQWLIPIRAACYAMASIWLSTGMQCTIHSFYGWLLSCLRFNKSIKSNGTISIYQLSKYFVKCCLGHFC